MVDRLGGGEERTHARVGAVSPDEEVAQGRVAFRERQFVLAIAKRGHGGESVAPLDRVWGDRVEHDPTEDRMVDLWAEVARVLAGASLEGN